MHDDKVVNVCFHCFGMNPFTASIPQSPFFLCFPLPRMFPIQSRLTACWGNPHCPHMHFCWNLPPSQKKMGADRDSALSHFFLPFRLLKSHCDVPWRGLRYDPAQPPQFLSWEFESLLPFSIQRIPSTPPASVIKFLCTDWDLKGQFIPCHLFMVFSCLP